MAADLTSSVSIAARDMASTLRAHDTGSVFKDRDIYNDRQRLRDELLGGLSATQAWIKILQEQGLKHFIRYDDENRVQTMVWTYPWCQQMWKKFPEVIGLDNTYKTNRFQMYLFQVTGITDHGSVAPLAFGLVNTEKQDGYDWVLRHLEKLRCEVEAAVPKIVITDKETALKNALREIWPDTQQQLCVWHINANVRARIRSR